MKARILICIACLFNFCTSLAQVDYSAPCLSISARAKAGKVQLTWPHHDGTERYDVYRANESAPSEFEKIGETTSTYCTYLDTPVENETTYLYMVVALPQDEDNWCSSEVISSHPTAARTRGTVNYSPIIYSLPVNDGTVEIDYSYDVNATDPNGDELSYSLLDSPADMEIDPASGLISWIPPEGGFYDVTVEVADGNGETDTHSYSITIPYVVAKYAAIVDVMVTGQKDFDNIPDDYTGLTYGEATSPYISKEGVGERVSSGHLFAAYEYPGFSWLDVWTSIWVKYDLVPVTSNQPVLVEYGVFNSEWGLPSCPAGWQRANGTVYVPYFGGIQGALSFPNRSGWSTGQWPLRCTNRHSVLCVRYEHMNETDTFITNVGLSNAASSAANCAPWGEANGGYWVMQSDGVNIVHGCNEWRYVCYSRGEAWPEMPTTTDNIGDDKKLELLVKYAPRVWFHRELYWPSSVAWAFPHLNRYLRGDVYWLHTKQPLATPSSVLPFFHGCNGWATNDPCTLDDAPVYAFWVKKWDDKLEFDYVDLVYFFYYPYNRGKEVWWTVWGSHIGDWEHVTLRLFWAYDDQTDDWSLQPKQMYLSAHDFGGIYERDEIPKEDDTHPIVYAAEGSHGFWLTPGRHVYKRLFVAPLVDLTGPSTAWDTWNHVKAFDYNEKEGLGGSNWPQWMEKGEEPYFTDAGDCGDPSDPACGPIFRWGNHKRGCHGDPIGQCRLTNGPTGPVSKKNVWDHGSLR